MDALRQMTSQQPEMSGNDPVASFSNPFAAMASQDSSMSGILAFLDKTFMDKALDWQSQRPEDVRESATYKVVREMDDEQQRRYDTQ